MYSIVPEICIGGHFLEDCFYCYSQQIKPAAANESLINYNLIKRTPYFFWVENWYLLTWNLAHMLSNLKTFKEAIKTSWMWHDILYWSHHISASSASNLPFTCFCKIANFSCIFPLLFRCLQVLMSFLWEHFCLNIYYEIFYFILVWLKGVKIHKIRKRFFSTHPQ